MTDHIVKAYGEELDRLKAAAVAMGKLSSEQLEDAISAVERSDVDLAARVVEREPDADQMEHQIERLAIRLLALRQPMAIDLREILSALRIANELERICDYAEDLAKRLIALQTTGIEPVHSLINLGRFAITMVKDAMSAYEAENARQAQDVWDRDKTLDEMYTGLFRELLTYMLEDVRRMSASTHMLFMARAIERVGDRATNIAEMVRYLVSGTPVEEERPKADMTKSIIVPANSGVTDATR
jgi:phosphate transport system protein